MINFQIINGRKIAVISDENITISSTQDAVDLLGEAGWENCRTLFGKAIKAEHFFS